MAYLRLKDYQPRIQDVNLSQILTGGNDFIRTANELSTKEEVLSYLRQKYDVTSFGDILTWSPTVAYNAGQLVELNASAYVNATAYVVNDLTLENGFIYICTGVTTGAFDATKWTKVGTQYDLFFAVLPNPKFSYTGLYKIGDIVFWKNKVYTAKQPSIQPGHESDLQYRTYDNIPINNTFPDDAVNGSAVWGTGTAYTVSAGVLPTDTTKWTKGDNRDQKMVEVMVMINIYKILQQCSPRVISQQRIDAYNSAVKWLDMVADGKITANLDTLPILQPAQGSRIRSGSDVKRINSY